MISETLKTLPDINHRLEQAAPSEILSWAWNTFGDDMVVSSSFQTQSVPLLHIVSRVTPSLKVIFVDTGFHFPETIAFRDELVERFNLNLLIVEPQIKGDDFIDIYGPLYLQSPDACCFYNKVAPFQLALKNYSAWLTGIRRDQTENRSNTPIVDQHPFLPAYKICPMARWSGEDVETYINEHDLPRHPLHGLGYFSIGCQPCTVATSHPDDARQGRWPDQAKNECGMHIQK